MWCHGCRLAALAAMLAVTPSAPAMPVDADCSCFASQTRTQIQARNLNTVCKQQHQIGFMMSPVGQPHMQLYASTAAAAAAARTHEPTTCRAAAKLLLLLLLLAQVARAWLVCSIRPRHPTSKHLQGAWSSSAVACTC